MNDEQSGAAGARRTAERALVSGMADEPAAASGAHLLEPLSIASPDGHRWGWMVPLDLEGHLLGFVQVTANGTFHRYASFSRGRQTARGLPTIAAWTDRETILRRAGELVGEGIRLSEPVLTFDRAPDRLHWLVAATAPDGGLTRIAVAGDAAWIL